MATTVGKRLGVVVIRSACLTSITAIEGTLILLAGTFTGVIESYLQSRSAKVGR
jgi:hypothetical protein